MWYRTRTYAAGRCLRLSSCALSGCRWSAILSDAANLVFFLTLVGISPLFAQTSKSRSPASPSDVTALLHAANEAFARKDFSAAIKSLKSVLEIQPGSAAWFNLAYAYSGLGDNDEAVQAYKRTLELQPDLFEARLNLGILFIKMNQTQPALEHLAKAVELKPDHSRAHLYYGRALSLAARPEAAERQFVDALRLDPNAAFAHFDLGQLYLAEKKYADARTAFEKAQTLDPKLAQAELGLALAWEGSNDRTKAITCFEQYLAEKPDDQDTRFHLARMDLEEGKNEAALENLRILYQSRPDLPGLAAALGDACALLKKFPDSEKFYRQALVSSPGEPDLHRALGQTLYEQQKFAEAATEFRTSLELDPGNREAAKGLANSLYLDKHYLEALPLLEALTRAPNAPAGVFFLIGSCYDHLQDALRALGAYQRFLELARGEDPDREWQARQRVKTLQRLTKK